MFDKKEMQAQEIKPSTNKTWDSAKVHFVSLYNNQEKFNAEHEACTSRYKSTHRIFSASSIDTTPLGTLSPVGHQSILKYTNSLKSVLEHTQEHAATLTTTQDHRLKQLEVQQQDLLIQTNKLMELLSSNQNTPPITSTAKGQVSISRCNAWKPSTIGPHYCKSCQKADVYHKDDAWYALEKNKDKHQAWYITKM